MINLLAHPTPGPSGELQLRTVDGQVVRVQSLPPSAVIVPNVVSVVNAAPIPSGYPFRVDSPPIAAQGSGLISVSASASPQVTGSGGTVLTFTLWRDFGLPGAVALVACPVVSASGGPQNVLGAITPVVDQVPDQLPHVYSLVVTNPTSAVMQAGAKNAAITAGEL